MLHEKPAPTRVNLSLYLVLCPMISGARRGAVCRFGQAVEIADGRGRMEGLSGEKPEALYVAKTVSALYEGGVSSSSHIGEIHAT